MTRSELINRIAAKTPALARHDVELAVREVLNCLNQALTRGERIELRGFGSLYLRYRRPRMGRNPKNGEKIYVPGKYVPHFKPGRDLKVMVNRDPSEEEPEPEEGFRW